MGMLGGLSRWFCHSYHRSTPKTERATSNTQALFQEDRQKHAVTNVVGNGAACHWYATPSGVMGWSECPSIDMSPLTGTIGYGFSAIPARESISIGEMTRFPPISVRESISIAGEHHGFPRFPSGNPYQWHVIPTYNHNTGWKTYLSS